jgi:hypothetical protein
MSTAIAHVPVRLKVEQRNVAGVVADSQNLLVLHLCCLHAHGDVLHHLGIANATQRLERLRVKEIDSVVGGRTKTR